MELPILLRVQSRQGNITFFVAEHCCSLLHFYCSSLSGGSF
uniref:Uncharacterized protein n=1 Tax=Anguilla anguilla TaxID=7936 RepID=A0A0E9Y1C1_ANGAN